jgi:hypothetical protein
MKIKGEQKELAVEEDFGVARPLELLEDHLVHAGPGVDQRRGDDRQRTVVLGVAGRAEEAPRLFHGPRVDAP